MNKDRSAKLTKNGKISIKLKADEWQAIENALRLSMGTTRGIDHFHWCLLEEVLEKLESSTKLSIQFRLSEFYVVFHADVFQYIDQGTTIVIDNTFENIRKEALSRIQHEQATYRALVKRVSY